MPEKNFKRKKEKNYKRKKNRKKNSRKQKIHLTSVCENKRLKINYIAGF